MNDAERRDDREKRIEAMVEEVKRRAGYLFESRRMLCTESVFSVMNQGFNGGLGERQALSIAAGLPDGIGGSGCVCGALSGGIISLGLLLAKNPAWRGGSQVREASAELHRRFKERFKTTCCRTLTRKVRHDKTAHMAHCGMLTAASAEMTVRVLLLNAPTLLDDIHPDYLARRERRWQSFFASLIHRWR